MPLPERVQIGPLTYEVTCDEAAYNASAVESGEAQWGRIQYGNGRIVLCPDQAESHKRMALLHEILHGVWHLTDRKHTDDEAVMLALSGPLLDTLRRNTGLVSYLMEEP